MNKSGFDLWTARRVLIFFLAAVFVAFLVPALWFSVVPRGASFAPWMLARVDGPVIEPPSGGKPIRVYFNDAGAAHSGYFWTWVVRGNRVIAEGYSKPDVRYQKVSFPLEWIDDRTPAVTFLSERYGGTTRTVTVKLK